MNKGLLGFPRRSAAALLDRLPELPDLVRWWRSDAGVDLDGSNNVSNWHGQVPDSDAPQTDSIRRPAFVGAVMDGMPALRFTQSSAHRLLPDYSVLAQSDYTIFTVAARRSSSECPLIGTTGSGTSYQSLHITYTTQTTFRVGHWNDDLVALYIPPYSAGEAHQMTCTLRQGYGRKIESLGLELAYTRRSIPLDAGALSNGYIGGRAGGVNVFADCDFFEILMFNRALLFEERRLIEWYLLQRYPSIVSIPFSGW